MKLNHLSDVLKVQLKDLYSAEQQLTKALPKMAHRATNSELKSALANHLRETVDHVGRLERIAEIMDVPLNGHTCKAMKGLIVESEEILDADGDTAALDAGIIAAAQRVEHYEMAAYGTAREFAELIGEKEVAGLLATTLDEEMQADRTLSQVATSTVNRRAAELTMS
ncbi:MAG: ferritin-like domain-containing protein [Candidatus Zixiibacteriota bacterium]